MKPSVIFLSLFFLFSVSAFAQGNLLSGPDRRLPLSVLPSTVTIDLDDGAGSGTVIQNGKDVSYILTCDHVVKGEKSITVMREHLPDLEAKIVLESSKLDLALLEVPGSLPTAEMITDEVMEGEGEVIAGAPFEIGVLLTQGFVGPKQDDGSILGTAAAWPGVSGGGVYVDHGGWRLAGVAQAIMQVPTTDGKGKAGSAIQSIGQISFFIPLNKVRAFLKEFHG